jgi:signal transduction histidine kinase
MKSLRGRLMLRVTLGVGVLLMAFGSVIYVAVGHLLREETDRLLLVTARTMAGSTQVDDAQVEIEFDTESVAQIRGVESPVLFQFWLDDGFSPRKSRALEEADLPKFSGADAEPEFRSVVKENGEGMRALGVQFAPLGDLEEVFGPDGDIVLRPAPTSTRVVLVVACSTRPIVARMAQLRTLLLGSGAVTMVLAVGIVLLTVRRGLQPLNVLARQIADVQVDDLSEHLPAGPMPTELAPVVARLNELLDRLDAAMRRERGFTADVAHELRTPLAGIHVTIDVALSRERTPAQYAESLGEVLGISERMEAMVEHLLTMARLDAKQVALTREVVGLNEVVDACWHAEATEAESRGVTFENRVPPESSCLADRDSLLMMLANLFSNAAHYTDDAGRVWVTAAARDGMVEVTVANTGCTLTSEEAAQVFERFWRGDAARSGAGRQCGLGLPLVQRLAIALGGGATARVANGGIFEVTLTLPPA